MEGKALEHSASSRAKRSLYITHSPPAPPPLPSHLELGSYAEFLCQIARVHYFLTGHNALIVNISLHRSYKFSVVFLSKLPWKGQGLADSRPLHEPEAGTKKSGGYFCAPSRGCVPLSLTSARPQRRPFGICGVSGNRPFF